MNATLKHTDGHWLAWLLPGSLACFCLCVSWPTVAQDLPAVSDGQHLWLLTEDPEPDDQARLLIYHLAADAGRGQMVELDALVGELMPRGVAAGDGRLLVVLNDRGVRVIQPTWSDLLRRWTYTQRSLPAIPSGVAVLSVAIDNRGPWALVRVESAQTLEQLDRARRPSPTEGRASELNRALGLPEDFQFVPAPTQRLKESEEEDRPTPQTDEEESEASDATAPGGSPGGGSVAQPALPVYRLIRLRQSRWVSSPLPDGFAPPRHASLILRPGDERPTIVSNDIVSLRGDFTRFSPLLAEEQAATAVGQDQGVSLSGPALTPAWQVTQASLRPAVAMGWSAVQVKGQAILVVERSTSESSVVAEAYLLRGPEAIRIGRIDLPTNGRARWSAVPWRGGVALVARPGPTLREPEADAKPIVPLGGLLAITLDGTTVLEDEDDNGIVVLYEDSPTPLEGNADLLIQILAFLSAMVVMMLFYRRAPRGDQIDLPDDLVLASFARRLLAGVIDLLPGFWIAGLVYDITIGETILYWPGNGVPKALPAMRPGFLVIAVTVVHTTAFEFVTARSMGKWFTGLYVADLDGKPAPPTPSLLRAVSRLFDLFAPLMLVLPVISPGRQRLGDILAKTIVVMRLPEEQDEQEAYDDDDY